MQFPERYLFLEPLGPDLDGAPRTALALDRASLDEVVVTLPRQILHAEARFQRAAAQARGRDLARSPALLEVQAEPPMVVTAWVPGYTLADVLSRPLDPLVASYLVWEVTQALAELHAVGVPHGDIHPGNIRVTPAGAVRLVGMLPQPYASPETTVRAESPHQRYAPPEATDFVDASAAGDVYSLGLVLYEIYTGRPALTPGNRTAVRGQQRDLTGLLESGDGRRLIPGRVASVLRMMLQEDRAKRPRTAVVVLDHLDRLQAGSARSPGFVREAEAALAARRGGLRRRLIEELETARELADITALASRARRLAELGPLPDRDQAALRAAVLEVVWLSFRRDPDRERGLRTARCALLEVFRAAALAHAAAAQSLVVRRIRQLEGGTAAMQPALDAAQLAPPPARSPLELRRVLLEDPADDLAALELALVSWAPAEAELADAAAARVAALTACELPGAALVAWNRELSRRSRDPDFLARLGELAAAASRDAEASAPPGRPAPESGPGSAPPRSSSRPPRTSTAPPAPAPAPTVDRRRAEEERRFADLLAAVEAGAVRPALADLTAFLTADPLHGERHYARACARARRLAWRGFGAPDDGGLTDDDLLALAEFCDQLELRAVAEVFERQLVERMVGAGEFDRIEALATKRPASYLVLTGLLELAEARQDVTTQYRCLVHLGWLLLDLGEVTAASRKFLQAKAFSVDSPLADEGLKKAYEDGLRLADAAKDYRVVASEVAAASTPMAALERLEAYLGFHPGHLPALERAAGLYHQAGDSLAAAWRNWDLAHRARLRGDLDQARERLREVLRVRPDDPDAALLLASLDPEATAAVFDPEEAILDLFEREKILVAAIHRVRRRLRGTDADLGLRFKLVDLYRRAGRDPSPHLLAQAVTTLEGDDPALARELFDTAIRETADVAGTIDTIRALPGCGRVFSDLELETRRRKNG